MNLITQMEKVITKSYANTAGLIIQKEGKVCYENYWNDCNADKTVHIFSVTKSITSILIGIAIDMGYIEGVNCKILDFFPDYTGREDKDTVHYVTLRDMLTMTAPYRFKTEPYEAYFKSSDWVHEALDLLGGKEPAGTFRYAGIIGPDVFSGILHKTTGLSESQFAFKYLFEPLGIESKGSIQFTSKEEQMDFYKSRDIDGWVADDKGVNTGGWGLTLTVSDMAKIGQLYLNQGLWNGQQIVSSEWIAESTKKQSRYEKAKLSYGYLWWLPDEKQGYYAAMGDGGNIIYVNHKEKLVIAMAGYFIPNARDRLKLIKDYIEPAFR